MTSDVFSAQPLSAHPAGGWNCTTTRSETSTLAGILDRVLGKGVVERMAGALEGRARR